MFVQKQIKKGAQNITINSEQNDLFKAPSAKRISIIFQLIKAEISSSRRGPKRERKLLASPLDFGKSFLSFGKSA